jgi:hypothetical protein
MKRREFITLLGGAAAARSAGAAANRMPRVGGLQSCFAHCEARK